MLIRILLFAGVLVAASSVAVAQETPKTENKDAAVTFSGKGGGPIKVVDHRKGTTETDEGAENVIRPLTPEAAAREEAMRAKMHDEAQAALEAYQKKRQASAELAAKQAAAAEAAKKVAKDESINVPAALAELRKKNWITFTQDEKQFPEVVYDPSTGRLVPTLEAIKSLKMPPPAAAAAKPGPEKPKL